MKTPPGLESFIKRTIIDRAAKPDVASWLEELKMGDDLDSTCICDWLCEDVLKTQLDEMRDTFFKECLVDEILTIMQDPKWIDVVREATRQY